MNMIASWIGNIPDFAVPFALAALGLIIIERTGVLALGAEGLMLVGALSGIGASLMTSGSTFWALIIAMIAAAVVSQLFALMVLVMRINQVIAGLALVFFCQGLTGLLGTLMNWTNKPVPGLHAQPLWPPSDLPVGGQLFIPNPVVALTPIIFMLGVLVWNRTLPGHGIRDVG